MEWMCHPHILLLSIFLVFALTACGGGGGGHPVVYDSSGKYQLFQSDGSQVSADGLFLSDTSQIQATVHSMDDGRLKEVDRLLRNMVAVGGDLVQHGRPDLQTELDSAQTALNIVEEEEHRRGEGGPIPAQRPPNPPPGQVVMPPPRIPCDGATPPAVTPNNPLYVPANGSVDQVCRNFCLTQSPTGQYYLTKDEHNVPQCNCPRHVECVQKSGT